MTTNKLVASATHHIYWVAAVALVVWYIAYTVLQPLTEFLTFDMG